MAFPIRKEYTAPHIKYLWKLFAEMVDQIVVGTLTWFHIFSVIGWSGAALTFLVTIKPSLAKFSPQASSEFSLKVIPQGSYGQCRYFQFLLLFLVRLWLLRWLMVHQMLLALSRHGQYSLLLVHQLELQHFSSFSSFSLQLQRG